MKLCQIKKEYFLHNCRGKIKRLFRPKNSYKQEAVATFHAQEQHILNFYNVLVPLCRYWW